MKSADNLSDVDNESDKESAISSEDGNTTMMMTRVNVL